MEAGAINANFASAIKKARVHSKELVLPTTEQFLAFVHEIENGKSRDPAACSNLVRLMAFTGMRIGEAIWLTWSDCNFGRQILTVRGHPETGTKNSEIRLVPLIPAAKTFLERLRNGREEETPEQLVTTVSEANSR